MRRKPKIEIDRDKIRTEARKLDGAGLRIWLDRAIDLLPDDAIPELIADYVHLRDVLTHEATQPDVLRAIREFHRESMAGRYYQSFNVNSRNSTEKSRGTEIFIADHSRLVEACLRAERSGDLETAAEGLELLVALMREIDRCERDIVFFADEAGSWQVGVLWDRVLPAWFRSLSPGKTRTSGPRPSSTRSTPSPAIKWPSSSWRHVMRGHPNSAPRWQSTKPTCAAARDETRGASRFVVASRLSRPRLVHTKCSGTPAMCAGP